MPSPPDFDVRDPAYRPLLGAQALTAFEKLEHPTPAALLDTIDDAFAGSDEMADHLPEIVDPKRRLPVCQKGCSYCCHSTVLASAPEILRIATHVNTLSPEARAAIDTRVHDAFRRDADRSSADRARAAEACPLLDPADGSCSVHAVRPFACRAYHSCDVEPCKRAFAERDPNPVLPIDVVRFRVPHATGFGLMAGVRARGLFAGPLELVRGLHEALLHADPTAAWLRGEAVFTDDPATRDVALPTRSTIDTIAHDVLHGGFADLDAGAADTTAPAPLDADARRRARNKRKRDKKGR